MKGKDRCTRCYYFIKNDDLSEVRDIYSIKKRDGVCRSGPEEIHKYYNDWCGKFKNNNEHIMGCSDD